MNGYQWRDSYWQNALLLIIAIVFTLLFVIKLLTSFNDLFESIGLLIAALFFGYNSVIFMLRRSLIITENYIQLSNISNKGHLSYIPKRPINLQWADISSLIIKRSIIGKGKSGILFLHDFLQVNSKDGKTYLYRIFNKKGFEIAIEKIGKNKLLKSTTKNQ